MDDVRSNGLTRANRQPHPNDGLSHVLHEAFTQAEQIVLNSAKELQERFRSKRDELQGKTPSGKGQLAFFMHIDFKLELALNRPGMRWTSMHKVKGANRIEAGKPGTWAKRHISAPTRAKMEQALKDALLPLNPEHVDERRTVSTRRRAHGLKVDPSRVRTRLSREQYQQLEDLVLDTYRAAERLREVWAAIKVQRRSVEKVYTVAAQALDLLPHHDAAEF